MQKILVYSDEYVLADVVINVEFFYNQASFSKERLQDFSDSSKPGHKQMAKINCIWSLETHGDKMWNQSRLIGTV